LARVGKGNTHTLDHGMDALDYVHRAKIAAGGQIDRENRSQPLSIRGALVEGDTAVLGSNRLIPRARVGGHILWRDPATVALYVGAEPASKIAAVDIGWPISGNAAQRGSQGRDAHQFAGLGRPAIAQ